MNSRHPHKETDEKLDFTLVPLEFEDVVKVLMFGVKKGYEKDGWQKGIKFSTDTNLASIRRHANSYRRGDHTDSESGLNHMLHIACRALMQYTLDKRGAEVIDPNDLYVSAQEFYRFYNDFNEDALEIEHAAALLKIATKIKKEDEHLLDRLANDRNNTHEHCLETRQRGMRPSLQHSKKCQERCKRSSCESQDNSYTGDHVKRPSLTDLWNATELTGPVIHPDSNESQ